MEQSRKLAPVVLLLLMMSGTLAFRQSATPASIPEEVKAHHKTLFSHYFTRAKNIEEETRSGRDVDITVGHHVDGVEDPEAVKEYRQHPYPSMALRGISCDADAVIVAVPTSSEADLTADGKGLFTDYRFEIESVLKNSTTKQLENSSIIVTRPGGETTINGRRVQIRIDNFPQFIVGQRYLLFLRHLTATDTFEAFEVGSFEFSKEAIVPFRTDLFSSIPSLRNESAFLTEVRAAVTAPCTHQRFPTLGKPRKGV
jgi:hypothetical protein